MKRSYHVRLIGLFVICTVALLAATLAMQAWSAPGDDAADPAMAVIRPEGIRAGMRFLADDLLEGRGTGTRGYEIAAKYMASEFEGIGLKPAGDNGTYFQQVPFRQGRPDESKTSLTLVRNGKEEKLVFRENYITFANPGQTETTVEAPVVFVGDGVTAPELGYDDYKGIDAKGKIVALVFRAPNFESTLKAHYTSFALKNANAAAHGAAGVILLNDPIFEKIYPFKEMTRDLAFPHLRWLDKQGRPNDYWPELKCNAVLNLEATKKLLEGSGHTPEEVFAALNAGKPDSFVLPVTARIHNVTKLEDVQSPNIVAKLEGSDPALKNEYVVYSAHLDHLGIGEPENGDNIYNGALDNASGSAILLELARAFRRMNPAPRRSILFVSVAGEEAGLLGSDYFAHYPTVPRESMAANLNMDEDLMLWPLEDIIGFGAEHSTLQGVMETAAKRMNLSLSPDPLPDEVIFIRSDQYSFVKQGVPAVFPVPGFKSSDPKIKPMEIFQNWEATRYHHPGDDMNQPGLLFDEAAKYARFMFLCGYLVANETQRPSWNKGDFFGEHYGKK
ncbi:MAG TPA: M28 family peptidase [Candidatus Acidoferrum sp.]|nr:M28 family peptidase [Candidatus Acidoferrum sp.]